MLENLLFLGSFLCHRAEQTHAAWPSCTSRWTNYQQPGLAREQQSSSICDQSKLIFPCIPVLFLALWQWKQSSAITSNCHDRPRKAETKWTFDLTCNSCTLLSRWGFLLYNPRLSSSSVYDRKPLTKIISWFFKGRDGRLAAALCARLCYSEYTALCDVLQVRLAPKWLCCNHTWLAYTYEPYSVDIDG